MEFRKRLKELMEDKNITQVELSKNIGVSQIAVSKWLNGKNDATASSLFVLSNFFDVTSDYLLGIENKSYPSISPKHRELMYLFDQMSESRQEMILLTMRDYVLAQNTQKGQKKA